ncbi:serine hydrolase [Bacillus sp. DX4.1]|uniref:serine hydrolase n=1 Tax=Bacillus sp. DX4.1 TaxID=3055867 RepID=UPI0025A28076|nr:serine hydrolase [Bacillus sp. DX4.1]MDM5188913.1 serine hydrolase [Bacillus sp. DX4.1]
MKKEEFVCELEKLIRNIQGNVSVMIQGAITYRYNEQYVHPSASLMKLPILACAIEYIKQGCLNPYELIPVSSLPKTGGSGIISSLYTPNVTIQDLLTLMITVSDNTATNWFIKRLGMNQIQKHIDSLQLVGTKIQRYMMHAPKESGKDNFTTAEDIVSLLHHYDKEEQFYQPLLQQQFTHKLCGRLANIEGLEIANKTGERQCVTHDVARFKIKEQTVYIAVLSSDVERVNYMNYIFSEIGYLIAQYISRTNGH